MENNIYMNAGYQDRTAYLESLANQYETDFETVEMLSDFLGHNEDFDGLISALEEMDEYLD